jgi:phosphoglucosamine mutase
LALPENIGRVTRIDDGLGRYIEFAKTAFPRKKLLDGLKIVVDCANGAAYKAAPVVLWELGAEVIPVGVTPNGYNINLECGSTHPQTAAARVVAEGADLGICLDGDADRVILIDEKGRVADGDQLMGLIATNWAAAGKLSKNTLVATVMSNMGLERYLGGQGIDLVRTAVGDRYVVETMRQRGFNFGGEQSGHLVFLDHATTGDGLVAAMQVLGILVREQRPLSELTQGAMERVPQVLVNVSLPDRRPLKELRATSRRIAQAEQSLGKDGRVLVRWSGTEPKLRVMIEGPEEDRITAMAQEIADEAKRDFELSSQAGR